MKQILILSLCLLGFAFASEPRITQIIPFGTSSVRITFNQDISKLTFKEHILKDFRSFLDIQAVLAVSKKNYIFSNRTEVSIAQNTPQITRIVIKTNKDSTYQTKIIEKHLYISIIDKLPDTKTSEQKSTTSKSSSVHPKPLQPVKSSLKSPVQASISSKQISKKPTTSTANSSNSAKSSKLDSKFQPSKPAQSLKSKPPNPELTKLVPKPSIANKVQTEKKIKKKYKIVIDPGHGGKDCGAMGVSKICEKVIVLSVAKFLEQELKQRGYIVYMTRHKDIYINLKERTDFANAKNADLFVSIHANSVPKTSSDSPQGVETYFLSTARSERARKVAELENKDDIDVMNYFSKFSFLNSLNSHRLIASNKLAIDIQFGILRELRTQYKGVVDGGVREGPFWVLAGALMPSVLVEIGYNSNPIEARRIDDKRYQRLLAKGMADGIDGYFAKNY